MAFIERLRQEQEAKALSEQQLRTQQEVREKERLQRETVEKEHRAERRQQSERFREESKVGIVVAKLGSFFASTRTIPTIVYDSEGGSREEFTGRGSSGIRSKYTGLVTSDGLHSTSYGFPFSQRDPDSAFDTVHWDTTDLDSSKAKMGYDIHSEKYLAVETCPDGTIVFHAGWFGGTTVRLAKWRSREKEQIFDRALEKAYKHPGIHRYSEWHKPVTPGFG